MLTLDVLTLDGNAWIEIAVAFVAYFVLSWLWWGPLFGKPWAKHMGMEMEKPDGKTMGKAMLLQVISTFLLVYVLWHVMMAFTVDLDTQARTNPTMSLALQGSFYTWLGFMVPMQLGRVAWEKASWALAAINAGGQLAGLVVIGLVFSLM